MLKLIIVLVWLTLVVVYVVSRWEYHVEEAVYERLCWEYNLPDLRSMVDDSDESEMGEV